MLIDLHTHTKPLSWDSFLSPDELIERSKAAALDGICLSEHDFFWKPEDVQERARRHDFLVLPAIEINTDDGHMLVYGLEQYVYGMHRSHELAHHIEQARGVMVAAHPHRRQMSWYLESERDYHEALARASRGPAGPDAHARVDIGRCATYFEREIHDLEELIEELQAGRFRPVDMTAGPAK